MGFNSGFKGLNLLAEVANWPVAHLKQTESKTVTEWSHCMTQLVTMYCKISLLKGKYRVIQKVGLNFVRLYFLNYTRYVNDLHNI